MSHFLFRAGAVLGFASLLLPFPVLAANVESSTDLNVSSQIAESQAVSADGDSSFSTDGDATSQSDKGRLGPNLVPNPRLIDSSSDVPTSWEEGGYGTNTRSFNYPVAGLNGSNGAQVTVKKYQSGDADWYFDPLSLEPGSYRYVDHYLSNVPSVIELQLQNSDGSYSWSDLKTLPAASSFTSATVNFTVPAGTQNVTVYHLIQQNGFLTITNTSVRQWTQGTGIFQTGGVTFRFDDGWQTQYTVALPALQKAGIQGTFYVITRQLKDYDYSGFLSIAEVKDLAADGEEVGDHTRTHPHLPQLSAADQKKEIVGAKQDLESWGITPLSFAYPYGEYDSTTLSIVKANFQSGAATLDGDNVANTNPYTLHSYSAVKTDSAADLEKMINTAVKNHEWLILAFHRLDNSGDEYSTVPATFKALVNYVASNHIPTVTVSQGVSEM